MREFYKTIRRERLPKLEMDNSRCFVVVVRFFFFFRTHLHTQNKSLHTMLLIGRQIRYERMKGSFSGEQ